MRRFDPENRLRQVQQTNLDSSITTSTFIYDADGQRFVDGVSTSGPRGSSTSTLDAGQLTEQANFPARHFPGRRWQGQPGAGSVCYGVPD